MRLKAEILRDINLPLTPGVNWAKGAEGYVQGMSDRFGKDYIEYLSLAKPLCALPAENHSAYLTESVGYLQNFTNLIELLRMGGGAKIMDVACGGGWLSHFMSRMGYRTFGFDISADFIGLARRRLESDPVLRPPNSSKFAVHDIESCRLPPEHHGLYDAIIMESCLHHFLDPITALTYLAECLNRTGVMVIIEGENRASKIKPEYQRVMDETHTLERPYPRHLLVEMIEMAGLTHYEFLGAVNGWFAMDDPRRPILSELVESDCLGKNLTLCALNPDTLQRIFPWRPAQGDSPIEFARGVYEAGASGWRWVAPFSQIKARRQISNLTLFLQSEVPSRNRRQQHLSIHDDRGLRATFAINDGSIISANLGCVDKGDVLTLCSTDFFVPARHGTDDPRQLSFALKVKPELD